MQREVRKCNGGEVAELSVVFGPLVQTLQHGCWSHTRRYTQTHTHTYRFIPLADCLILSPQGGVSLQESMGLRLDTKVRGVIILSLTSRAVNTDIPTQPKHTHTPSHPQAEVTVAFNTAQVSVTMSVVIMVVSSHIRSSLNPSALQHCQAATQRTQLEVSYSS